MHSKRPEDDGSGWAFDRAMLKVDVRGDVWVLNDPKCLYKIDWRRLGVSTVAIVATIRAYVVARIATQAPASVYGEFDAILSAVRTDAFKTADGLCFDSPRHVLGSDILREMIGKGLNGTHLHRWRGFYRWACLEADLEGAAAPHFSERVVEELDAIAIGKNPDAVDALDLHPTSGPLLDIELFDLIGALGRSEFDGGLTLQERVAIWLGIGLGQNTSHYALLRVEDFNVRRSEDGAEFHTIRIPRLKKRDSERDRSHFKTRRLNQKIGRLVEDLVRRRLADPACTDWIARGWGIPLFSSGETYLELVGTPIAEYALHMRGNEFSSFLREAVAKLEIVSPRTGRPLSISPRRLRHTFATNAAIRDAPPAAIAEALDHSSLKTVMVYVDNSRSLAEKIDRALDAPMRRVVQAFRGRIVGSEAVVLATAPGAERIYAFDDRERTAHAVGSCAASTVCDLQPPVSCYTCISFRPWRAANHRSVLASLKNDRDKRVEAGLSDRMVRLHDRTIDAVEDVVRQAEGGVAPSPFRRPSSHASNSDRVAGARQRARRRGAA